MKEKTCLFDYGGIGGGDNQLHPSVVWCSGGGGGGEGRGGEGSVVSCSVVYPLRLPPPPPIEVGGRV